MCFSSVTPQSSSPQGSKGIGVHPVLPKFATGFFETAFFDTILKQRISVLGHLWLSLHDLDTVKKPPSRNYDLKNVSKYFSLLLLL